MEAKNDAVLNRGETAPSLQVWDISQVRLRWANREDVLPIPARLEDLLPPEHLARQVWEVVSHLDLSAFYAEIVVTRTSAGRPAIDPLILVAVWVYALSQGETEGREVARLCVEHLAYIWLCGGVSVNHHRLSDFLGEHEEELDGLFTQVVVRLDGAGLVGWEAQAQDCQITGGPKIWTIIPVFPRVFVEPNGLSVSSPRPAALGWNFCKRRQWSACAGSTTPCVSKRVTTGNTRAALC